MRSKIVQKILDETPEEVKEQVRRFADLQAEKSKQGTSPEPLVSDDTQLGTGCSSFASGATKDEGLDAAPLGHKIHDGNKCPCGEDALLDDEWCAECRDIADWTYQTFMKA